MKLSLLDMVQSIMSDMDSDEVQSINDTPESEQVASIIQDVYYQLISNELIPELQQLIELSTVGSPNFNYLSLPTNVSNLNWLKYNKIKVGDTDDALESVKYMCPEDFVQLTMKRKSSDTTNQYVPDPKTGFLLLIQNDKPPEWWTSFDDLNLCFDSWDNAVDTAGLVGTKTVCWGSVIPTWTVSDGFIPTIDDNLFPFLLSEAKATCFANIKQTTNPKVEKQARFQRIFTQNDKYRTSQSEKAGINSEIAGPNFGRRSSRWNYR